MTFAALSTGALLAAALAVAAAVVTLYLLRRTPRPQVVSNVEFWKRAVERSRPRSLFATRVPWLAMLISLAIALLMVVEMGDPRSGAGVSGTTVIVLDADRTMAARDERGRRRLDDALVLARETAQSDTVSGQIAVVRAGPHPEVIVPLTRRAADAERALTGIEPDDSTADLSAAVAVARAIVRGAHATGRVIVVADRDDFDHASEASVPVTLVPVGTPAETVAVAALDARRDPLSLGEYRVRCEVRSYSSHRARAHLVLRDRDVVVSEEHLDLGPGEVRTHLAHGFSSAQAELTARLEDIDIEGGHDALASDDLAYAAVAPAVATRVLLVTRDDRYLADALEAHPSVALETIDPAALAARRDLSRYHVVILDRVTPARPLDHPAQLLVGSTDARAVRLGAEVNNPRVTAFATDHRVLAGLRFDQVQIAHARALLPAADDRVLVRSGRNALMVARERDGARLVAMGFDTESTDLVQRVAFPLFLHNALVWLDRREREFHSWQPTGEPIRASGSPAVVLTPSGAARDVRGALYDTARAGIYHTADRAVAVSAADDAGSLAIAPEGMRSPRGVTLPRRASLAVMVAAMVLALMCVEWIATQRGRLQ